MGTFTVPIQVGNLRGRQFVEIEALVDTEATHTLLPRDVLHDLAIEVIDHVSFQLADERVVDYEVGEARIRLDGRVRTVLVAFGPQGAKPLLGATTLDLFNMGLYPVKHRLVPVTGLLK